MKKLALITAFALIGVSAMAGLVISFSSAWGFTDPVIGQGEDETLWALLYSSTALGSFSATDGGITDGKTTLKYDGTSAITATGSTVLGTIVAPGTSTFAVKDVIEGATLTTTGSADEYMGGVESKLDAQGLAASYSSGYIYQAVFQKSGDTVSYFVSDAIAAADCGDPPVTTTMYIEDAGSVPSKMTVEFDGTYTVGGTQVPEPATLSLLGLGALALAIRRRK